MDVARFGYIQALYWPGTEIDIVSGLAACHDNLTMGVFPRPVTTNQKQSEQRRRRRRRKIIEQTNEQQKMGKEFVHFVPDT